MTKENKKNVREKKEKENVVINKNKIKTIKKIRTKMIKILIVLLGNDAKFDNIAIDTIKLIVLIYNNFNII